MKVLTRFAVLGAACLGLSVSVQAQTVRVEGPSAMQALSRTTADEYQKAKRVAARIDTGTSGTAGALQKLCGGTIDIAGATRPIQKVELERCAKAQVEFIELPVAFDAVTIVVHPGNTFVTSLSVEELRRMWQLPAQGAITRWNQVNPAWPNLPLTLLGADVTSDEGAYFNEAILGRGKPSRGDYISSAEDEVLAQGVARSAFTLGYVSLDSYLKNRTKLKAVPISTGGAPVAPSIESVAKGMYQPLARPLFYYVAVKSLERAEVRAYVEFLAAEGARLARGVNLAPLADVTYRGDLERVRAVTKGSVWDGTIPVGLTVEALQKKYAML